MAAVGNTCYRNSVKVVAFLVTFGVAAISALYWRWPRGTDVRLLQEPPPRDIATLHGAEKSHEDPTQGGDVAVVLPYHVDYIPEDIALQLPACKDYKMAADVQKSKLSLQNPGQTTVSQGGTIPVSIKLYDGRGAPILKGGADVRPRMFNTKKQAYATAAVTDHGNGTYTAIFDALWEGQSTIKAKIAYTPETIRAIYYLRKKFRGTNDMYGVFATKKATVTTLCHPTKSALLAKYSRVCNLTWDNSGMPWYCGRPDGPHLLCEDWSSSPSKRPVLPLTKCERGLIERSAKDMKDSIAVTVKQRRNMTQVPTTSCKSFNRTALWTFRTPTGFMQGNKWRLSHCKDYDKRQLFSCLRNKKVLLFGDSTVRQWFHYIQKQWQCSPTTGQYTTGGVHREKGCINRKHNFTVQWLPHSHPFFGTGTNLYIRKSISRRLDEIGKEEQVIVLIHTYLHTLPYHYSVFRQKFRRIRASVQNLLNRNRFVKVLIKGFHTFYDAKSTYSDYFGKVFRHIVFKELSGLHDKIVYLDQKDITDARAEQKYHPSPPVVAAMVDQMMSYIC